MIPNLSVPDFEFSMFVESSPPGQARLQFDVSLSGDFGVHIEGATAGRTPPETWPGKIRAVWSTPADIGSLRDVASDLQVCVDLNCWLMSYDLFDGKPFSSSGRAVSGDIAEAEASSVVTSVNGVAPTILVEAFGCYFLFTPEGDVQDGGSFGHDTCSKASFVLE